MYKFLVNDNDLMLMIQHCYESDIEHILKVHVTGDLGLDHSINRTVIDLLCNNVSVYALYDKEDFIGYFGDEAGTHLTGFFIMPQFRKTHKSKFWDTVVKHFNGNFKCGIYSKNLPARNFLIKSGCTLNKVDGPGMYFEYKENI